MNGTPMPLPSPPPPSPPPSPSPSLPTPAAVSTPLGPTDRAASAVCADWLATSRVSAAAAAASAAAAFAGVATGGAPQPLLLLAALLLAERYLALRLAFDERLFARLAEGASLADLAALDSGLQQVLALPAAKAGRPLPERIAGARRLHRRHMAVALACALPAALTWI